MEKLNVLRTALAVAITLAVINVICAVAVSIWPNGSIDYANAWTHGLDFAPIKSTKPITAGTFVYGVIGVGLLGFVIGAVYAWVFNLLRGVGSVRKSRT